MGKNLDKFLLLLWKNWKLQYRRPLQTSVEIAAPILFSILLVILRSLVNPTENPQQEYYHFHPILSHFFQTNNLTDNGSNFKNLTLVYSPSPNAILDRSMSILKIFMKDVKGYQNSKQLEHHFLTEEAQYTLAAVQFDDDLYGKDDIPDDIEVSLRFPGELRAFTDQMQRNENGASFNNSKSGSGSVVDKLNELFLIRDWKTNVLYPIYQTPGPREFKRNYGASPNYYSEGFLALQVIVTHLLILTQVKVPLILMPMIKSLLPVIHMQRFPHASWKDDPLLPALISFTGILIMLSFVYTCINTVKLITSEKERQLKETMKIMGLPNWLHWTAWFIKSFSFLLLSTTSIVFLLTVSWYPQSTYSILTYANPLIFFFFLSLYMCATITFCFSVTAFFSKANTAATVAGLLWFLSYSPYLFLQSQYDQVSLSTKLLVSLGSNTAMAYGFQVFLMYEGTNEGIQWNNIWKPITTDDKLTLGLIMAMLFVDALIYLCIALYVEAVFPGEYGTPQKWYFPVTYSYWFGNPRQLLVYENESPRKNEFLEESSSDLNCGIRIKNLRKNFGKKVAVDNLSLNIYDDQITVLLGHNGAGKTSTMSILTGIIPPTGGTALIRGFDIRTNMKDVRKNLGLCPQHNVLFDDLTVREHLFFFTKLKGLRREAIDKEIDKYVHLLELVPKANKKSSTLSGGMMRKLCVGIALCGGSKVVLLDEPTAGMDPSSRRALWDLLQAQKKERCILLTTHYMDEADLLGDRIAIMANGELKCCGSSFFLKKKFGTGYHLILEKQTNCDPQKVTKLLRKYISDIEVHRNVGSELVYLLKEDHVALFENMLDDLEKNLAELHIRSYGISLTTLEDVFLKVGADSESVFTKSELEEKSKTKITDSVLQPKLSSKKVMLLTGFELIQNQFVAMLMKKALYVFRTWLLQLIQIIIPVAFLILAILISRRMNKNKIYDLPKLALTLDSYENPITLVEDNVDNNFSKFYLDFLKDYQVENVKNITSTMLNLSSVASKNIKQYLVGASFDLNSNNTTVITAWFNNNPYHTPALALALVLNAVYKTMLGEKYNIIFANYPLPFSTNTKMEKLLRGNSLGFQVAFNVGFSMAFVSSFYVLFTAKERVCKSKHLQFVSGVKSYIFWTTCFICDLVTFIITILALIITLLCFQEEGFREPDELGRMFLVLFYFGFAMLPMMYFAAYLFDIPSTGFTRMTLFSIITGVTAFLVVQILNTPALLLKHVAEALHWGFLLVPHYSLATGIRDIYITFATTKMCDFFVTNCLEYRVNLTLDDCRNLTCNNHSDSLNQFCCDCEHGYFKWQSPGIGRNLLYSFLSGLILFFLINLFEYKLFARAHVINNLKKIQNDDEDVSEEERVIHITPESQLFKDYSLIVKDMTKYYKNFWAVKGICLGVKQFECFGFLGVNGAGKTTTFKMITGDTSITYGNAWIHGYSVKTRLKQVQKVIGYCPQFDALLTDLTAKETLIIFALLRGVPLNESKCIAERLAQDFDFYQHLNKKIKQLSGGNKRKLSTAVSLIGDPPVICLDEPTAGMDPVTKRHLWNVLCSVRDNGKCILFTSHSMEECEALCTRLAIMVNGVFKCLGSLQHLKNKFAAGYTLTVKMKRTVDSTDVEKFIEENFPKAKQQEKHQELMTYYIVDENISCSKMFGVLERAKNRLNIEDYSLGQASLEQIFVTLTRFQR